MVSKNGLFFTRLRLNKAYLCRSCGKRKNVTFFLLDVFLHPNLPIYNLQFIFNLNNKNHYENSKQPTIDKIYLPNISGDYHGDDYSTSAAVRGGGTWRLLSPRIFFQRTPSSLLWPIQNFI